MAKSNGKCVCGHRRKNHAQRTVTSKGIHMRGATLKIAQWTGACECVGCDCDSYNRAKKASAARMGVRQDK